MSVIGYNDGTKTAPFLWAKRSGRTNSPSIGGVILCARRRNLRFDFEFLHQRTAHQLNNQYMSQVVKDYSLAPEAVSWARRADEYYNGTALYDNKQGRFIAYAENERDIPKQSAAFSPKASPVSD